MVCLGGLLLPSLLPISYIQTEKLTNGMPERAYERYAWVIFFIFPIFFISESVRGLLFVVPPDETNLQSITGMTWSQLAALNPRVAEYIGFASVVTYGLMLSFAILIMAISATSYRRGEKWSWYALWIFPLFSVLIAATRYFRYGDIETAIFDVPFLLLILLGLLLPYRKFFPKKGV